MKAAMERKTDNLIMDEVIWAIAYIEGEYVLLNQDRPEGVLTTEEIKDFIEGRG